MITKNYKGEARTVGFEIEFQNIAPSKTAEIIAEIVDGRIKEQNDARYLIDSSYGEFIAETDAKLIKKLAQSSKDNIKINRLDFEGVIKDILEPITKELVPTEIVSPPMAEPDFDIIRKIETKINEAGARGTNETSYFAFAMQFNPEIKSSDSDYLLSVIQAYILLSPWLRSQIEIGHTRELTGYVDDFPKDYAKLALAPKYSPSIDNLIDDYLEYNPTRNRGLDMLPLFLFLDKNRVRAVVKDERVKARPTFHYRLPSCQFGLESWNVFVEWKRWILLERIAEDKDFLKKLSHSYLSLIDSKVAFEKNWVRNLNHFIEDFRS